MLRAKTKSPLALILLACLTAPDAASTHASEQGFVLLLPTGIYTAAGTLTVVLTLIVLCLVPTSAVRRLFTPINLGVIREPTAIGAAVSLCSGLVFWWLIYLGAFGPTDPLSNLLPLTVWTVWWVGLVVLQALFGDIWRYLNPWTGLYHLLFRGSKPPLNLPEGLGCWPAVVVLLAFYGFAIADIAPTDPTRLASFALGYWVFTFAGMILFGARSWLERVECFSVFFGLISHLAPIQLQPKIRIGFPGFAFLDNPQPHLSRAVFCLILLGSGSFDGLHETFWWLAKIGINPLEFPGRSAVIWTSSIGLLIGNIVLISAFATAIWIGWKLLKPVERASPETRYLHAFSAFAITIVPIAFGYHIAHFTVSFLVEIQYFVAALSDPFATGGDLLSLGNFRVTTGFLNTQDSVRTIWLSQAFMVVFSHVLAVLLAHHIATTLTNRHGPALKLQVGLGGMMIAYTIFGLWLLASPRGV